MPKKGHTCCVLGCTVNSKKTQLTDGRKPRFFCFPHEKKRPHLRRAWLALTRRTEASTNTRVCEFHFVDSKPSSINPHPILNMGMEATKMQKRAMELRQQKELRRLIMQQQMAAGLIQMHPEQQQQMHGQALLPQHLGDAQHLLPGHEMVMEQGVFGAQMTEHDMMEGMYQDQDCLSQLGNSYVNIKSEPEDDQEILSCHMTSGDNPLALVAHKRPVEGMDDDSMAESIGDTTCTSAPSTGECMAVSFKGDSKAAIMAPNGESIEQGLMQPITDYDAVDDSFTSSDSNQSYNPHAVDDLPEDCVKYIPLNSIAESLTPPPIDEYTSSTTNSNTTKGTNNTTNVTEAKDDQGLKNKENGLDTNSNIDSPSQGEKGADLPIVTNSFTLKQNDLKAVVNQMLNKTGSPLVSRQNGIGPNVSQNSTPLHTSTPLKVPSWRFATGNGTTSTTPSSTVRAKKPRKRKSTTPLMKTSAINGTVHMKPHNQPINIPGLNIPTQPQKTITQSNILMSMHTVEGLKSDILENLRAEFLTELQNESESNKQLKVEMETIRMQTRQELQQMRVELHALWGENQRLRSQVENLLQDKEGQHLTAE